MKKYLYFLFAAFVAVGLGACSPDDNEPNGPGSETPAPTPDLDPTPEPTAGKTLIVYYSPKIFITICLLLSPSDPVDKSYFVPSFAVSSEMFNTGYIHIPLVKVRYFHCIRNSSISYSDEWMGTAVKSRIRMATTGPYPDCGIWSRNTICVRVSRVRNKQIDWASTR